MSRLGRFTQIVFGSTETNTNIAEFGSLAASAPARYTGATITPAIVQALANYAQGWFGAVVGSNAFAIEDMNALCYLFSYQLAYLLSIGVPEWDPGTTYYIGDLVNDGNGNLYVSLTNANVNNAITSNANWAAQGYSAQTVTATTTLTAASPRYTRVNNAALAQIMLPASATLALGQTFTIKNVSALGLQVEIVTNGTDTLDGNVGIYPTALNPYDSINCRYAGGGAFDVI